MYCRQWYLNVSRHCTGGWVGSFSPLVSSHLAQGGLAQMQEGNTSGTWSFEHWNLVTWASLSTGLQGEGAAVPWVFGRRAGYVIMYGCVRWGGVICKHIACCVRGWTNVHQSPEASRGRGSTWILHSSRWRWRFLDTFDYYSLCCIRCKWWIYRVHVMSVVVSWPFQYSVFDKHWICSGFAQKMALQSTKRPQSGCQ